MALKNKPTMLNGINPLSYLGVNPYTPSASYTQDRAPTPADNDSFQILDLWMNSTNNDLYYLAKKSVAGVKYALWVLLNNGADLETLTGDVGGPVGPDVNRNINTLGTASKILVTGNPGTNTLTWSLDGSIATQYNENVGSAIPVAGILNVLGTSGITTSGAGNTVTITTNGTIATSYPTDAGTAIPAAGVLNVLGGTAARDINTKGSGNTIHVDLNNAITLGDLSSIVGSSALTCTTGDVTITSGNFNLVSGTNAGGTVGMMFYGGEVFLSNFGTFNTFMGPLSGNRTCTGTQNTTLGRGCLSALTSGTNNDAFGLTALFSLTSGSNNATIGGGVRVTTGDNNVLLGQSSGNAAGGAAGITTGSRNVLVGAFTGSNYTSTESNNIMLGDNIVGTVGESNVCRIGAGTGAGSSQVNKTFISGIRGITTAVNDAVAVLIDSAGQLGTTSSSGRYKENVRDMGTASEAILDLRPVVFNYIGAEEDDIRYGLIAEEVAESFPYLTAYNGAGEVESVKYHELAAILLNEVKKLNKRIKVLEEKNG